MLNFKQRYQLQQHSAFNQLEKKTKYSHCHNTQHLPPSTNFLNNIQKIIFPLPFSEPPEKQKPLIFGGLGVFRKRVLTIFPAVSKHPQS